MNIEIISMSIKYLLIIILINLLYIISYNIYKQWMIKKEIEKLSEHEQTIDIIATIKNLLIKLGKFIVRFYPTIIYLIPIGFSIYYFIKLFYNQNEQTNEFFIFILFTCLSYITLCIGIPDLIFNIKYKLNSWVIINIFKWIYKNIIFIFSYLINSINSNIVYRNNKEQSVMNDIQLDLNKKNYISIEKTINNLEEYEAYQWMEKNKNEMDSFIHN